jgi:ribosome-binding protein aMBF1 (putative translation factor)
VSRTARHTARTTTARRAKTAAKQRGARTATAVDRQIAARLRAARKDKGISQQALATKIGVTFQQIQKYEKGSNRIAASRLYDIAVALDLKLAYFFPTPQAA